MSFRYRLALFLIATLTAVQALTALAAYTYLRVSVLNRTERELVAASGDFIRQLDVLSERVASDVEVLSLDYALRRSIARHDFAAQLSALRDHDRRVGATRMMIVGPDGTISADTGASDAQNHIFPYTGALAQAAGKGDSTALIVLGGHVYWMVVVPVYAPVAIAFVAECIPVDDRLLEKIRSLSTTPRAIALAVADGRGHWRIVGQSSNNPPGLALPVPRGSSNATAARIVNTKSGEYLAVAARLPTPAQSAPVLAILAFPLSEAFASYRAVILPVLLVLGFALVAAAAGAFIVVGRASRPIEELAATARRVAQGDYTIPVPLKQNDEIGQLSEAIAGMTQSIAEREAALRSTAALEIARREAVAANEAKSRFLANMSHEFRTPLNAILGLAEMLKLQVLGPIGAPRYAEYAHDIYHSGKHLLGLVARILDMADAEAGRFETVREPFDAGQTLDACFDDMRDMAAKANVELALERCDAHCPVLGDAGKLREALTGILQNAVKFTPAGGRVDVSLVRRPDSIVIQIADTGIGMRTEDIPRVTRPFHRLRGALDGQHQGAGLGLPYANAVIVVHDGKLSIESELHIGTTVEVMLPLMRQELEDVA